MNQDYFMQLSVMPNAGLSVQPGSLNGTQPNMDFVFNVYIILGGVACVLTDIGLQKKGSSMLLALYHSSPFVSSSLYMILL